MNANTIRNTTLATAATILLLTSTLSMGGGYIYNNDTRSLILLPDEDQTHEMACAYGKSLSQFNPQYFYVAKDDEVVQVDAHAIKYMPLD